MPRTTAVAPSGCPPLRVFSFDNLGLIKVIESSKEREQAQVVARWGEPSLQRSVVAACLSSDEDSQVLAVARRNFKVEILDPSSGSPYTELNVRTINGLGNPPKNFEGKGNISLIGVHLFRTEASGLRSVLTCTDSGNLSLQPFNWKEVDHGNSAAASWSVCKTGNILCMKVDKSEKYVAFGGDGADVTLWDIQTQSRIWEAKAPRRDSNGLMSRPYVTASTFLGNDHKKLVVGTGHHQIRLYDIGARRRAMMAFEFLESPIKAVEADIDGNTIYVGTGNGDLASFDMRSGKILGSFKGKISGSIRSIAVHPTLPVFAACGLDRFLRVFHKSSRQLLTQVFLKQPLVATVFDMNYPVKSPAAGDDEEGSSVEYNTSSLVEPENDEVHRSCDKKIKKTQKMKDREGEPSKIEKDVCTAGKAHKKRKREKGKVSTTASDSVSVLNTDTPLLMEECATTEEPSECVTRKKPVTKLKKIKKAKNSNPLL